MVAGDNMKRWPVLTIPTVDILKNNSLFKELGLKAKATDYAILINGNVGPNDKSGSAYYLMTPNNNSGVYCVGYNGEFDVCRADNRFCGIRPMTLYSDVMDEATPINENSFYYGYFPQTVVSDKLEKELTIKDKNGQLEYKYPSFTKDLIDDMMATDIHFIAQTNFSFKYKDGLYLKVDSSVNAIGKKLSDGRTITKKTYFVKVEPLKWYILANKDLAITSAVIMGGIQMNYAQYDGHFKATTLDYYLNNYLANEISAVKPEMFKEEGKLIEFSPRKLK